MKDLSRLFYTGQEVKVYDPRKAETLYGRIVGTRKHDDSLFSVVSGNNTITCTHHYLQPLNEG